MNSSDKEKFELDNKYQDITKESALALVRKGGYHLKDLPIEFRNDKDVVLEAVRERGFALEYASKKLRNDREVVLEAVKRCSFSLEYASKELQNDREIVFEAIRLGIPSFMGKSNYDEKFLSNSLEVISNNLSLLSSSDLIFLCGSKWNIPIAENYVPMGWYQKIFSKEAKLLGEIRSEYRRKINIIMEKIREDTKYRKEQSLESEKVKQKEERARYQQLRKEIEAMPKYENWKNAVFMKYGRRCEMCGKTDNLEIHHRRSFNCLLKNYEITTKVQAFECDALWNVNNGSVLCKECHDKMTSSQQFKSLPIDPGDIKNEIF